MAAEAGELCSQCWAGTLQLHEGMLVCDVCGSIHQVRGSSWVAAHAPPCSHARCCRGGSSVRAAAHARDDSSASWSSVHYLLVFPQRHAPCLRNSTLPSLQGFAEEAQEYQTGISDARFFKCVLGSRAG
mgnify:CR=1 FL=1